MGGVLRRGEHSEFSTPLGSGIVLASATAGVGTGGPWVDFCGYNTGIVGVR